jgi:hypothetical protein
MTELELERERVVCVFGLGGGELHQPHPDFRDEWDGPDGIAHWHEGVPEYASELKHLGNARTAIIDCLFGVPDPPEGWRQVASFTSSGERECWWCAAGPVDDGNASGNGVAKTACPLCEGDDFVYIGDGWREVVYRRVVEGDEATEHG